MQLRSRSLSALVSVLLCLALLCGHIAHLARRLPSFAASQPHTRTLLVGQTRGKIYARDGSLLVDRTDRLLAAAAPCGATRALLEQALGKAGAQAALTRRAPCLLDVQEAVNGEAVRTFAVPNRYAPDDIAVHLVGTLDAQGKGATGIERAFDPFLSTLGGTLSVRFCANANGQVLAGLDKEILDNSFNRRAGVALTIDPAQQRIVEEALAHSGIRSGCAVLMDTGTGQIRALASVPVFNRESQTSADPAGGALRNKALGVYAPGSVMKPLLAAFALEQGVSPNRRFTCRGQMQVGDTVFHCFQGRAHGRQTMGEALQHSCNVYFIRLLQSLDAQAFWRFCRRLGLGAPVALCDNLQSEAGLLPPLSALDFPGQRALFAFGQGQLLLSPLHLLAAYHTLATGLLVQPTAFFGAVNDDLLITPAATQKAARLLSSKTVRTMRRLLCGAVKRGVSRAWFSRVAIAGKTGTAQSGIFNAGRELCRTWFCGFFPAGNPHYILVILNEDGVSGNRDCAPVCKEICARLVGYAADS